VFGTWAGSAPWQRFRGLLRSRALHGYVGLGFIHSYPLLTFLHFSLIKKSDKSVFRLSFPPIGRERDLVPLPTVQCRRGVWQQQPHARLEVVHGNTSHPPLRICDGWQHQLLHIWGLCVATPAAKLSPLSRPTPGADLGI
jgi:hypothetical protein